MTAKVGHQGLAIGVPAGIRQDGGADSAQVDLTFLLAPSLPCSITAASVF